MRSTNSDGLGALMLTLGSQRNKAVGTILRRPSYVAKVTTDAELPEPLRKHLVLHWTQPGPIQPSGFRLVLVSAPNIEPNADWVDVLQIDPSLSYISSGDVVAFDSNSLRIRVLFRQRANINSFLLTERCNSFCLMCSQPPREVDDGFRIEEVIKALPLISSNTREIMFSGGEPTLLGDRFLHLLSQAETHLPRTAVHVLTNGRTFQDRSLALKVARIRHHDLMLGIPIYADTAPLHDFIVQADNAFNETIRGVLNLKQCGVRVEIRVVIHKQNYLRLPALADFLVRNLLFVDQVALMGLEVTGFTKANFGALWIDPWDYREQLREAVTILDRFRMRSLVFNHQLCTLDPAVRRFSVKAISDWKNEYASECLSCDEKNRCGGFFSTSGSRRSAHIRPLVTMEA